LNFGILINNLKLRRSDEAIESLGSEMKFSVPYSHKMPEMEIGIFNITNYVGEKRGMGGGTSRR